MKAAQVRPARPEDAAGVAGVWHRAWHAGHAAALPWLAPQRPPASFEARAPGVLGRCLVAEAADGSEPMLGFAAWNGAELAQLFVEPSQHGAGTGRLLLAAAEAAMLGEGVGEAWLTCVVGNGRGRAFYLRYGWEDRGVEDYPAQVGGGTAPVPVWRMTKRLRALT